MAISHTTEDRTMTKIRNMDEITQCVICGKWLARDRTHVDTCGRVCFKALLRLQRATAGR